MPTSTIANTMTPPTKLHSSTVRTSFTILLPTVLLALVCSGCASFNRVEVHHSRLTTIGQELTDLKKAKDQGLLSDDEYAKSRKDIFDSATVGTEGHQSAQEK